MRSGNRKDGLKMADKITINLFCNEGEGLYSRVETEKGWVGITPTQFLEGWQGRRPPFSNNDTRVRDGGLDEGSYEAAAWCNDEGRAKHSDASGRRQNVVVERRGEKVHLPGNPVPPDDAIKERLIYLNLQIKPAQSKQSYGKPTQAAPVVGKDVFGI